MCGLSGIFQRQGRSIDRALMAAMNETLSHRGPDASGVWVNGNIGLAHRRLSIRDIRDSANQPMADTSGVIQVVFNGEIYNDRELRKELAEDYQYRFVTQSDTEIIPAAYLAWGTRMFSRLEGMFAIALWDQRNQTLILARDGVGIKPLFVSESADTIRFGSEVKALLRDPEQLRVIDETALPVFLAQGYVAPDRTLLKSVSQIPPGVFRTYSRDQIQEHRFWQPTRRPVIRDMSLALEEFASLWGRVNQQMLVSDVPVGIQQSGGIDSSLVTLTAADKRELPVFTASFSDQSYDELDLAKQVVASVQARHEVVQIDEEQDAETVFRAVVRGFDGQLADSSAFAVYQLNQKISQQVKVVLSGDGADEFFAGYPTYRASRIAGLLQCVFADQLLARCAAGVSLSSSHDETRLPRKEVFKRFLHGLSAPRGGAHAYWRGLMTQATIQSLCSDVVNQTCAEMNVHQPYIEALNNNAETLLERCMLADQRYYLPSDMLMKVDAMSMAHGLEVRVPFLDRRIMDFAGSLDTGLLTSILGPDKKLLRRYLQQLGAPAGIWQGKKRGFNAPVARLLRGGLKNLCDTLLDKEVERLEPYLKPDVVRSLWREHRDARSNHGYGLWCLLTFATWKKELDVSNE